MVTDDEWTIAAAGAEDLPVSLDLLDCFYREERLATTMTQMTSPLRRLLQQDRGVVLLASISGRVVGIAVIATSMGVEQGGLIAELTDLYVRPEVRKRGIGSALLLASAEWARREGCRTIQLVVTPEGQATHDLVAYYGTKGFAATGRKILARKLADS